MTKDFSVGVEPNAIRFYEGYRAKMPPVKSFQERTVEWGLTTFGEEIVTDKNERAHRFCEEAIELVQAVGVTKSEVLQLVDYVYGRDVGEIGNEIGGTLTTLAVLCHAWDRDMMADGEAELLRVWGLVEKIRAKHAAKPKFSPLPGQV